MILRSGQIFGGEMEQHHIPTVQEFKVFQYEGETGLSPPSFGPPPADISLIRVDGESMEPTLRPGDLILVDRREAPSLLQDGIYVMCLGGMVCVKRLQRLPGRQVRVSSDNPA